MSIFKRKYKDKQGRQRTAKTYSVRFKDHFGVYHIIAGFPSKRATETLNTRVHDLVSCKIAGANPDKEMEKWLFELPEPILKNFVNYGLIDGTRVSNAVSIEHHINDFEQYLKDKGCTHRHIITTVPRIEKIFQKSGIKNLNNIKSEALSRLVADLPLSEQTRKHYVRNLKQFSKWLFETNKTNKDILKNMQVPKVNDTVRNRRPLTVDEVSSLLRATRNSDYIFRGVDSYERYLIYRVAIETGMRANEIRTLIVSDLDFENYQVNIRAKNEKSRRGASLPLEESLSNLLQRFVSNKLPSAKVLNVPNLTSEMLQVDLKAAGIEYKNERGYVDFHALRHTFGTLLALAGTKPQIAQMLMRHSDPKLTQNLYTHLTVADAALGRKFPDLSNIDEAKSTAI